MSRDEIAEHAGYVGDRVKLAAYERALRHVIRPGDRVLDLGTGTGVLGMLAAAAGAGKVYAVDSGSIIGPAETIAVANGFRDRMEFIRESSGRLQLPEPVDVVVGDQIGGMVYDAGVLDYYADVGSRLMRPGGTFIPGEFSLAVAPVAAPHWERWVGIWRTRPSGLDLSPMFDLATNTEFRVDLDPEDHLGPEVCWATVAADHVEPIAGTVELEITRPGRLTGLAGTFVAQLCPGVELANSPQHHERFDRWQNFYPLREPVDVGEGDRVEVTLDVRPKSYLATWHAVVTTSAGSPSGTRSSTVLGQFLSPTDAARAAGQVAPPVSELLAADRYALELVDGHRTIADIAAMVFERHPGALRSVDDARRRVDHLLRRHLQTGVSCTTSPTG